MCENEKLGINICVIWESFQKIWLFVNHWMHLNTRKKIENWHSDALRNFRLACEIVKCLFCYNSRRCSSSPRLRIKRSLGGGFDLKLVTERCVSSWYHDRTCISQKLKCIENVKWFNARSILQNKVIFHNMSSSKKSFQSSENEKWYIFVNNKVWWCILLYSKHGKKFITGHHQNVTRLSSPGNWWDSDRGKLPSYIHGLIVKEVRMFLEDLANLDSTFLHVQSCYQSLKAFKSNCFTRSFCYFF